MSATLAERKSNMEDSYKPSGIIGVKWKKIEHRRKYTES
jgi:hypothetical protein